jgi:hypothetical protein
MPSARRFSTQARKPPENASGSLTPPRICQAAARGGSFLIASQAHLVVAAFLIMVELQQSHIGD